MKFLLATTFAAGVAAFSGDHDLRRTYTIAKKVNSIDQIECADYDDPEGVAVQVDVSVPFSYHGELADGGWIKFADVGMISGAGGIDLFLSADDGYAHNIKNGQTEEDVNKPLKGSSGYYQLNVQRGTCATFNFEFRYKPVDPESYEQGIPAVLPGFFFNFLDVDSFVNGEEETTALEKINVDGAKKAIITEGSNLVQDEDGWWSQETAYKVKSIKSGDDPSLLSQEQQDNSVSFKFKDASNFQMHACAEGDASKYSGRNFPFTFGIFPQACTGKQDSCFAWCYPHFENKGADKVCAWKDCAACEQCL